MVSTAIHSRMESSFDPMNQFKTLLGPKPSHPWGALIPQVLMWCFRRFCIEKLTHLEEPISSEQLWADHIELVHLYAPKGLESASASWLNSENIEYVHSSLDDYNEFFFEIIDAIDQAIIESNTSLEDTLAIFIDESIKEIIKEWLGEEYAAFLIFPMDSDNEDEFTDEQFSKLLESLMTFSFKNPAEPIPVEETPEETSEETAEKTSEETPEETPEQTPEETPEKSPPILPFLQPPINLPEKEVVSLPQTLFLNIPSAMSPGMPFPSDKEYTTTLREAFHRRKTFRNNSLKSIRGKTSKLIPLHKQGK